MITNLLPASVYRAKVEEACYALTHLSSNDRAYALFLHKIQIHATEESVNGAIAAIALKDDGQFALYLHWPTMNALPKAAFRTILKHEVLHPVYGHVGERWKALMDRFGHSVANVAADMVINQNLDLKPLEDLGMQPIKLADFAAKDANFKPNLTTTEYAVLLHNNPKVASLIPKRPVVFRVTLEKGALKGTTYDIVLPSGCSERAGIHVGRLIESLKQELEARGESNLGRGWNSSETTDFIKQLKRKSPIKWYDKLRQMETRCRSDERVATRARPSRRHPAHFGRIRHTKVKLWFGVDTSGSMGAAQLQMVQSELESILSRGESEITVIHCDAAIKKQHRFQAGDKLETFAGRGGTDFSPFLLQLHQTDPEEWPDLCVFYTDGYGCIGEYVSHLQQRFGTQRWERFVAKFRDHTPEGIPVLWLLAPDTTPAEAFRQIAPFGEIAVLPGGPDD